MKTERGAGRTGRTLDCRLVDRNEKLEQPSRSFPYYVRRRARDFRGKEAIDSGFVP